MMMASQSSQFSLFSDLSSQLLLPQQSSLPATQLTQPLQMSLGPLCQQVEKNKLATSSSYRKYRRLDKDVVLDDSRKFFKAYREAPALFPDKQEKQSLNAHSTVTSAVCELSTVVDDFAKKLDSFGDVSQLKISLEKLSKSQPESVNDVLQKLADLSEQVKLQTKMSQLVLEENQRPAAVNMVTAPLTRTYGCQTDDFLIDRTENPERNTVVSSDSLNCEAILSNMASVTSQEFRELIAASGNNISGDERCNGAMDSKKHGNESDNLQLLTPPQKSMCSHQTSRYFLRSTSRKTEQGSTAVSGAPAKRRTHTRRKSTSSTRKQRVISTKRYCRHTPGSNRRTRKVTSKRRHGNHPRNQSKLCKQQTKFGDREKCEEGQTKLSRLVNGEKQTVPEKSEQSNCKLVGLTSSTDDGLMKAKRCLIKSPISKNVAHKMTMRSPTCKKARQRNRCTSDNEISNQDQNTHMKTCNKTAKLCDKRKRKNLSRPDTPISLFSLTDVIFNSEV